MYINLTKREYKICLCILRYGYGYKKEKSEIRCHQRIISKLTGLNEVVIKNILTVLENKNIIKWNKLNKTLSFNRHIYTWKLNKTLSIEQIKLNKTLSKNLIKHKVWTKQNIKLEALDSLSSAKQQASKESINKEKKYQFSEPHLFLTDLLITLIKQNKPDRILKGNNYRERWANDIRLTEEIDKRSIDKIKEVIKFSQRDSFWKQNILSAGKLRDKFDQLEMKMTEGQNSSKTRDNIDNLPNLMEK